MNSSSLKIVSLDEYKAWFNKHRYVLHQRTPFHQPAWLITVAKATKSEVVFIGVYQGQDLLAVLPGFLKRYGPFRLFGSPLRGLMTSYLGPVSLTANETKHGLRDLIKLCNQFARQYWHVQYTQFYLREPITMICEEGSRRNWEYKRPTSYQLNLRQGERALWSQVKSRCRRQIRKSESLGIEIVDFKDDASVYYNMVNETFGRRNTTSWHSKQFYQALIERLIPQDLLWAWAAKYQDRIIAASLFFHDDREVYYLSGASLSQYRFLPTSYLLHWRAIVSAAQAGLNIYDFGGTGTSNIIQFKRSFNPELVESWSAEWSSSFACYAKKIFLASVPYLKRFRRRLNNYDL